MAATTMISRTVMPKTKRRSAKSPYSYWFYAAPAVIYGLFFLLPTVASLYFSLTRWTLFDATFIGFDNFQQFFTDPALLQGFVNTGIYAIVTTGLKVVFGMLFGVLLASQIFARGYLRSVVFFPTIVSTIGVGITFSALMNPEKGLINSALAMIGIQGPHWLTDPHWALLSVALVDVWKGVGVATVIYMAGIVSIPNDYFEAAKIDGAGSFKTFTQIILPLARPAAVTVTILSVISGLRSFDLVWSMTSGGPGSASDVIASVIYKEYQAGFFGLSSAGNVVLSLAVTAIALPLSAFLNRKSKKDY